MNTAKRIVLIGCVIVPIAVAALFLTDIGRKSYSAIAADFPEPWLQVEPGMTSDDARKLVGEPWADGRDLKIVDRWRVVENGVELQMDIWFEDRNSGDSKIARLSRSKRFMGLDREVYADPPREEEASGGNDG